MPRSRRPTPDAPLPTPLSHARLPHAPLPHAPLPRPPCYYVSRAFCSTHPVMLFPAFNMQHRIRKAVLGEKFWKDLLERRYDLSGGEYVSVQMMIESRG